MAAAGSDARVDTAVSTTASPRHRIAVWPTLAGVASAAGVILVGELAAVVMVCAAIYLLAAATGRPWSAWIGFAASLPLVGLGFLLHSPWPPIAAIVAAAVVLVVIGTARGAWRREENGRQLVAMLAFGTVAILAASLGDPIAITALVVVALLAHAAWDVGHHVRAAVVARPYAEFCAALDIALAVAVVGLAWFGGFDRAAHSF